MKPKFIVFEGLDGGGKTTIAKELKKLDKNFIYIKGVPSNTFMGNLAKKIPFTLFFLLDLVYLTYFYIRPSISKYKIILQDRYIHSIESYPNSKKWHNQLIIRFLKTFLLQSYELIYLYVPIKERIKRLNKTRKNKYHYILTTNPSLIKERENEYQKLYKEFYGRKLKINTKSNTLEQSVKIAKKFIEN